MSKVLEQVYHSSLTVDVHALQSVLSIYATGRREVDGRDDLVHPLDVERQLAMDFTPVDLPSLLLVCAMQEISDYVRNTASSGTNESLAIISRII